MSLSLASCVEDTGNNGSYDKEEFAVNFSVSSVSSIPKDTEFGIMASCTRNDVPGSMMSENVIQRYISVEEGKQVRLVPASEDDRVITVKGDHNFSFYGVYPFPEGDVDLQAVPVTIPTVQNFQAGITSIVPMIAYGKCSKVVATVNMDFKSIFSILEFNVPSDPVSEDEVNAELEAMAKQYELEVSKIKEMVPMNELTESLKVRKATKLIVDSAVAVAPKAE